MEQSVEPAVARVLEPGEKRPLEDCRRCIRGRQRPGGSGAAGRGAHGEQSTRRHPHPCPGVLKLEDLARLGAALEVADERGVDDAPGADHDAQRIIGNGDQPRDPP